MLLTQMPLHAVRVMKLTAVVLIAVCLHVSAAGTAQTVTLSEKNASLEKIIKQIRKQTGYDFWYEIKSLQQAQKVDIQVTNAPLEEVLNLCFNNQPLTWSIVGKIIVIKPRLPQQKEDSRETPLIDIRGRITNENGEPVVASILVKGTSNGTSSNADGYFELKNVEGNATLVISGVSIETREVKLSTQTYLTVTVKTLINALEEYVFKGYYSDRKITNTGNVSKVKAETIAKQPVSNPVAAMQGRVPGLEIIQQTGVPGGNFKVRIRGQNSIANGNDPLYIVDGVPFGSSSLAFAETSQSILLEGSSPFNTINPADIESIEVLKDADATAIYGSRGANGVILITTKKGKAGKTLVDVNFYTGAGKVAGKMELLNTRQYLDMRYEAFRNDGIDFTNPSVIANDLKLWDTTRYTDWQKELLGGTAITTDAQLSFSGGNNLTQFLIGAGYHRETTVFPGNFADQRLSVHLNLTNTSANQKFKTTVSVSYSSNTPNLARQDLTSRAIQLAPVAPPLYDANGNLNWGPSAWNMSSEPNYNPLMYTKGIYEAKTNNLVSNAVLSYQLLSGLEIKANIGYINTSMKAVTMQPVSAIDPANAATVQNSSAFSNRNIQNWIIEPQLSWKGQVGRARLNILAGATIQEQVSEGVAQYANGFTSEALMRNINAAATIFPGSSDYSQYRYNAVFGRINYNLQEKYIINITGRRDGSSRFGPGKQFANFFAGGVAWIFSHEKAMASALPFLSLGKIRASYGTSGNDQVGNYKYLDTYSPSGSGPYQAIVGLTPVRLYNPELAWEENRKLEVGLELGFIRDRILTSISYYRNRSSNQLVAAPLPPTTGFVSIQKNLPATVQNTGVEIELNTINIGHTAFTWSTSINLTIPRNKLVAFPGLAASEYANTLVVGEPLSIRKRYQYLGVDAATGTYLFNDVNADGLFNIQDQTTVKFIGTDLYGGLSNTLQYKGWQLDFLFQFVKQTAANYWSYSGIAPGRLQFNMPVWGLDRWQKPGDDKDIQRFSTLSAYQTTFSRFTASDGIIDDASFIRLKNLSLSWSLPQKQIQKWHLQHCRIFILGQNLLTLTGYKGLDPETSGFSLPPLRVLTAGIRVTL